MNKKGYIAVMAETLKGLDNFERFVLAGKMAVTTEDLKKICRMRAVVLKVCYDAAVNDEFQSLEFCKALKDEIVSTVNKIVK
jgi:hypothetical protein